MLVPGLACSGCQVHGRPLAWTPAQKDTFLIVISPWPVTLPVNVKGQLTPCDELPGTRDIHPVRVKRVPNGLKVAAEADVNRPTSVAPTIMTEKYLIPMT